MDYQQMNLFEEQESDRENLRAFREASLANHTALVENVKLLMMSVIYGLNISESFAKLTPDGLWLKMYGDYCQANLDGSLEEYCETWPDGGVVCGGIAFRLPLAELRSRETGLPSWPRPIASDGIAWKKNMKSDPMYSIWKCWKNGKQDRPIYYHIWEDLSPCQSADICEMMMGFPNKWTDLSALEIR